MSSAKYIGLDVHQATTVAAVLDASGKLIMEAILETKASTILEFIEGLRGELNITLEEGTCAAWLHDLLESHVHRVVVCDPRKNALLEQGNKSDKIGHRARCQLGQAQSHMRCCRTRAFSAAARPSRRDWQRTQASRPTAARKAELIGFTPRPCWNVCSGLRERSWPDHISP